MSFLLDSADPHIPLDLVATLVQEKSLGRDTFVIVQARIINT
jgi:hypothetical protein